jgi:hypothetical protein
MRRFVEKNGIISGEGPSYEPMCFNDSFGAWKAPFAAKWGLLAAPLEVAAPCPTQYHLSVSTMPAPESEKMAMRRKFQDGWAITRD